MSKSFDAIMKALEAQGDITDDAARAIIEEHGPLTDEEKRQVAAAIKMKRALGGQPPEAGKGEVSLDDYIQALSVLDAEDASEDDKQKARQVRDRFEGQ